MTSSDSGLIERVNRGEQDALETLLRHQLEFLQRYVRRNLGEPMRQRAESVDFVQETLGEFVRYQRDHEVRDMGHVRALLCRMAQQRIRERAAWFQAAKRNVERERSLPRDTLLAELLDDGQVERPSQKLARDEQSEWMRLGLAALDEQDRDLILKREFDQHSFSEIASALQISEDAARMRFQRALGRFAAAVRRLRSGRLSDLV